MDGRDFVIPEDVKAVAVPVLAHRLSLTAQAWTGGVQATQIVTEVVNTVAGPARRRHRGRRRPTDVG